MVASCSSVARVDSLSRCSERREVSEEDANRAVVRRWIETFNNPYTPQTEVDVLAPGYIAHAPGLPSPLDLEAWTQFTASFVEAFPDLRLTVEDIFSGGNMVAARVAFRGTHRGEFQGIPPTGKEVAFSSIEIDRMVDGKVQEHWFEMDLFGLMQQLGAIPEPEDSSEEASPT
jgi:predicted ester cyclase